jgi:hypothetical protein
MNLSAAPPSSDCGRAPFDRTVTEFRGDSISEKLLRALHAMNTREKCFADAVGS